MDVTIRIKDVDDRDRWKKLVEAVKTFIASKLKKKRI